MAKLIEAVDAIDTSFTIHDPSDKTKQVSGKTNSDNPENNVNDSVSDNPDFDFEKLDSVPRLITSIQSRNKNALKNFFDALYELKNNPQAIRVLHYGDSQIEGDRITDYLRLKLQGQFGGQGPGLISLMPVASSLINRVTTAPGWDRYNVFTSKDKRVSHTNYGILAGFNRFAPYKNLAIQVL